MAISLTEKAAKQIVRSLEKRGGGVGIRFGVQASGCSGFSYLIDFIDEIPSSDTVFEDQGIIIAVDSASLSYLDGTQVDYVREGLKENFKFYNPNAQRSCSCGKSFNVVAAYE